jgi:hypothetical protein
MNNVEKAMKDALQNGWNGITAPAPSMFTWSEPSLEVGYKKICEMSPFIDPEFWRALGKARGWKEGEIKVCTGCGKSLEDGEISSWGKHTGKYDGRKKNGCDSDVWHHHHGQWGIEWHKFIDHLAEGKTAESFFIDPLH